MVGLWLMLVFCSSLVAAVPRLKRQTSRGPLYDYVHSDDGMFSYTELSSVTTNGVTTYVLNMTSQQWYDETLSNRPVWWHYVVIHIPDNILHPDSAFLFVADGYNTDSEPGLDDRFVDAIYQIAVSAGVPAGLVKQVPNQPIIMENDGIPREEDDFIAWTWRRFYDEKHAGIDNPQVVAQLPMCKGAVKAMDTMQTFVKEKANVDIEKFVMGGRSKRGWTSWLTAAVDDRVIAVIPIVLSCQHVSELSPLLQVFGWLVLCNVRLLELWSLSIN